MNSLEQFYQDKIDGLNQGLSSQKKRINFSSTVRLICFGLIIFGLYFFYGNARYMVASTVIGFIAFFYLVSRHEQLKQKYNYLKALLEINKTELKVLNGEQHSLPDGAEFINSHHDYSFDIDLFGRGSFFQFSNRTATIAGREKLVELFTQNSIEHIAKKQGVIQELSEKVDWRQSYSATAEIVNVDHDSDTVQEWIQSYKPQFSAKLKFTVPLFSLLSLGFIGAFIFGLLPEVLVLIWFFVGLAITGFYFKKINYLYNGASKAKDIFMQYHKLLSKIEKENFTAELLLEKQNEIKTESKSASIIAKRFARVLNSFDQRNNLMISVFGNAFFLRDLYHVYEVEKWISNYQNLVPTWFETIAYFDAQNSLANFAFNHKEYVYPEIQQDEKGIQAEDLGHPLLASEKRIGNDFQIDKNAFLIITGANMAGKSTFLRTISLSLVMANTGLPVCAKTYKYKPIKLITSMRTSDSLTDDESYFFSELKRLKHVVDTIEKEQYLIVLDEILKGTNSTDKAEGSRKFVEKLIQLKATGIIATHDLSLCEVANEFKEVQNYYFDAEIINDELHFDYTLKTGICQNMNASFLLNKMGIV